MLIVLEGANGAGKTTLARKLVEWWHENKDTDSILIHHTSSTIPRLDLDIIDYANPNDKRLIVFDRWYLSEYVYPDLVGRPSTLQYSLDQAHFSWGEPAIRAGGLYLLIAGNDELLERRKRNDPLISPIDEQDSYIDKRGQIWQVIGSTVNVEDLIADAEDNRRTHRRYYA